MQTFSTGEMKVLNSEYKVNLLDGFLSKSWLDYISFGKVGTGGWANEDGMIHCVKASYDLEDEPFTVSLLKHEAQHAMDLFRYHNMASEDLEYRAKLVELIYSSKRNLLNRFLHEADSSDPGNGHGLAADRIIAGFAKKRNGDELGALSIKEIQAVAGALFTESNKGDSREISRTLGDMRDENRFGGGSVSGWECCPQFG